MVSLDKKERKVVLITGANAGIGYSLADRLLALDITILIVLACRNLSKAETAKQNLLSSHPDATIDIVQLDTSKLSSVYKACAEINKRYNRLDYLYLNAGTMPNVTFNYSNFFKSFLNPMKFIRILSTGEGLLNVQDGTTEDGLRNVFCTNVFGHYVLIRGLMDLLCANDGCQIIWTSSSNASAELFSIDDIQHENGPEPYSSSKYAIDLLSQALNDKFNSQGVYSRVMCPGFTSTNMTSPILPGWMWSFTTPLLYLFRVVAPRLCITPYNGAEALVWLFSSSPETTKSDVKYVSHCSVLGTRYVHTDKLDMNPDFPELLYKKLNALEQSFRNKFSNGPQNKVSMS
ncbi:3-keto-steroid reductase/17-beta-hydroxysteroid dehydrogenase 7-like isoform X2 [Lytechinus variegatus]|uniref:3-keto-steroid reductase/17-beta-hydroxysteroid dehydrogenase 7-like isoform X2 n=1 Tax=Lytechinus variegatus TaxID=7654 RepID=UPI001BB1B996|nr:3-keto-steroid reductase/17-beta-hydroxysteroid dehydrogenase 7-like isoform X2 [Lytechinus variegatus]